TERSERFGRREIRIEQERRDGRARECRAGGEREDDPDDQWRKDPRGPALVEMDEVDPASGALFLEQLRGDEKAAQDEEEIDAEIAAREAIGCVVDQQDRRDRDCA